MFEEACFVCGNSAGGRLYCSETCKERDAPVPPVRSSRTHSNSGSVYGSDLPSDSDMPSLVHEVSPLGQNTSVVSTPSSPTSSSMTSLSLVEDTMSSDFSLLALDYVSLSSPASSALSPRSETNKSLGLAPPPPFALSPPSPNLLLTQPRELQFSRKPSSTNVHSRVRLSLMHRRTSSTGNLSVAASTPLPPSPFPPTGVAERDVSPSSSLGTDLNATGVPPLRTKSRRFRASLPAYFSLLAPIRVEGSCDRRSRSPSFDNGALPRDGPTTPSNSRTLPRSTSTPRGSAYHGYAMRPAAGIALLSVTPPYHHAYDTRLAEGSQSPPAHTSARQNACATPTPRGRSRRRRASDVYAHPDSTRSRSRSNRQQRHKRTLTSLDHRDDTIRGRQPPTRRLPPSSVRGVLFMSALAPQSVVASTPPSPELHFHERRHSSNGSSDGAKISIEKRGRPREVRGNINRS